LHGCGANISSKERPKAVKDWMVRVRHWHVVQELGTLGTQSEEGSFVDQWWKWWRMLQPEERETFGGMLTSPESAEWGTMAKLCGWNGLLQVMATLLWWGEAEGTNDRSYWAIAVVDVSWVLGQLLTFGATEKCVVNELLGMSETEE
ncbi:hypothetical protein C8J57DRAFT_1075057, partial [Mycena rebaudengoi]